jgi:DNA-binding NarL/FixJ family response regulator
MKRITVLLVEDHTIVRQGLRMLIEVEGDIEIIGEAKTGREGVQLADELRPDVIVMDIAMPMLNGLQATRQILKALPGTKVLVLSAHADPAYVEQVVKVGARGYLVKQSSAELLAQAIRELQKGKTFFNSSISKRLNADYQKSPDGIGLRKKTSNQLTSREVELLQLVAEGHVNKEIASELASVLKPLKSTVSTLWRSSIFTILRVSLALPLRKESPKAASNRR